MTIPIEFMVPTSFELIAIAVFALSGGAAGVRRGYDIIGVAAMALVTSLGGALIRDALFLQQGISPVLTDQRYLLAVGVGVLAVIPFHRFIFRLATPLLTVDALGLAVYTIVGAQKAMAVGIPTPGVILIAVANGVGGRILRDIITRQEPLLLKPGHYYAATSFLGAGLFVMLHHLTPPSLYPLPALASITTLLVLRLASIRFNWRTTPLAPPDPA